jgi:hypothetical protein
MGVAIYPVLESGEFEDWGAEIDGKRLARASAKLEKIAKKAGVKPLHDFFSMSREQAIAEILDGDPDDPSSYDEAEVPPETWFSADEGLATIAVLLAHVEAHPHEYRNASSLLGDLTVFHRVLEKAAQSEVRWHLGQDV